VPELPEVETVVRGLRPFLVGRAFTRVRVFAPAASIVVSPSLAPGRLETLLPGRTVKEVERRGKNILIRLSGRLTLWVHLKMTGRFRIAAPAEPRRRHDLVLFDLEEGDGRQLRFHDPRRFGRLRLYPDAELGRQPGLAGLGPEPLEITAEEFVACCRRRARAIKAALLDQSFLAGIGNIYADEALHRSRIHPARPTTSLSRRKLIELHTHLQELLRRAIACEGTTLVNFAGVEGRRGGFRDLLRVYGRAGEPCDTCGGRIVRRRLGARSAHFCPRCQRLR
jgi:formamidopyrimidine-DNA glycosylase